MHLGIVVSAGGYSITEPLRVFLVVIAILAALPATLCSSVLKKHATKDGNAGSGWIPLGLLPYALTRFQHRHKIAIVWGYLFSNLLFAGAVVTLLILLKTGNS
ncbi:MAG TPA: hypothetical protein VE981_20940 [Planctomycetota bacterium]|nr:hypothetical protein [Planctomycetota bacterium]